MSRVAIVVLNYLNYKDTIECVNSALEMDYFICGIVIVDNGSHNNSYLMLDKTYQETKKVHLISLKKNQGYARGNNRGIIYAQKVLKADFVLVVNNDTVFIEKNYIDILLNNYKKGVGVIGSKILLKDGKEQSPMSVYLDFKDSIARYINMLSKKSGSCFDFIANEGELVQILHGCALLFTPDFFQEYRGFYKKTFLYGEEMILYLMCKCKTLRQVYVPETKIYHKEDQSSLMSFENDQEIINKYAFQSEKFILWWIVKSKVKQIFNLYFLKGIDYKC